MVLPKMNMILVIILLGELLSLGVRNILVLAQDITFKFH